MIAPLFLEQLPVMFVGLADTLVISYAGESAASGVFLVNQFNTIFIYLFTVFASGGAVVISQYIGRQDTNHAGESANQLLMFSFGFSVLLRAAVLLGNEAMLRLLFGKVENFSGDKIIKNGGICNEQKNVSSIFFSKRRDGQSSTEAVRGSRRRSV